MITERSMDMELNDSGLVSWAAEKPDMYPTKGDLMDIGTFADSLSDPTSFLKETVINLDTFLCDETHTNKETLHSEFAASVGDDSGRNMFSIGDAFLDSFPLDQGMNTFPPFDYQRCDVLMSSPLSCNDLESILNTGIATEESQVLDVQLLKCESDSLDAFSSSASSPSGLDSSNFDISSPSSSFSSQPGSPLSFSNTPHIKPEKFQGKAKRSKSCHTKNNNYSPYDSSKSTEPASSSPSPSSPCNGTAGVEQQLSKKDKKKLQNKNAAIRYRQKMKAEVKTRLNEEEELLAENAKLKEKVEDLQREIRYMANLMEEVKKARLKSSPNRLLSSTTASCPVC